MKTILDITNFFKMINKKFILIFIIILSILIVSFYYISNNSSLNEGEIIDVTEYISCEFNIENGIKPRKILTISEFEDRNCTDLGTIKSYSKFENKFIVMVPIQTTKSQENFRIKIVEKEDKVFEISFIDTTPRIPENDLLGLVFKYIQLDSKYQKYNFTIKNYN